MQPDQPSRNTTLDLMRAVAVILMILSHGIIFFHDAANPFLIFIVKIANTVVFNMFLFASGAATYFAYLGSSRTGPAAGAKNIAGRVGVLLAGYYLMAIIGILTEPGTPSALSLPVLLDILTFTNVPSYTEFFIPFIFFAGSVAVFRGAYRFLSRHLVLTVAGGIAIYLLGYILFSVPVPEQFTALKALLAGNGRMLRFPILQYTPVFLLGLGWGNTLEKFRNTGKDLNTALFLLTVATAVSVLSAMSDIPLLDPLTRWPPSAGFLCLGLSVIYLLYMLLSALPLQALPAYARKFFLYLGRDSYDLLLTHLMLLFLYRQFIGYRDGNALAVILMTTGLFVFSVLVSSLNWQSSASVFTVGNIRFDASGRYRLKGRYALAVIILLAVSGILVGADKSASPYGNFMPNAQPPTPVEHTLTIDKTWHMADENPIEIHASVSGSGPADVFYYEISRVSGPDIINAGPAPDGAVILYTPAPGEYTLRMKITPQKSDPYYTERVPIFVTYPLMAAWTLDWEGENVTDQQLETVKQLSLEHSLPYTHFFHPGVFVNSSVDSTQAAHLTEWVRYRLENDGEELALHLHMQYEFVRASGVTPRVEPRWGYKNAKGYDVLLTAYTAGEIDTIVKYAKQLLASRGLPEPAGFRAGGWFADANVLSVLKNNGLVYDSSGRDKNLWNGLYTSPWNLSSQTQPYYPSSVDANIADPSYTGFMEIPNNGGDTNGYDTQTLLERFRSNWNGGILEKPVSVVFLSHPQWAEKELPVADGVLDELDNYRFDTDNGPLTFVTVSNIYDTWQKLK